MINYLLDTNSFDDYINDNNSFYDLRFIKQQVENKEAIVFITPYTLYEYLNKQQFVSEKNNVFELVKREFYVLNINKLIGDEHISSEQGYDFWFEFGLHLDDNFETYNKKINSFYKKIAESLFPKMLTYSHILASLYLYFRYTILGFSDNEIKKIINIENHILNQNSKVLNAFYLTYQHDYKRNFKYLLISLMLQIVSATITSYEQRNDEYDDSKFNSEMIKRFDIEHDYFSKCDLLHMEKAAKKASKNRVNRNYVLKKYGFANHGIIEDCFLYLIANDFYSKDLFNDFIDITNIFIIKKIDNSVIVTNESKWIQLLLKTKDPQYKRTIDFIKNFLDDTVKENMCNKYNIDLDNTAE